MSELAPEEAFVAPEHLLLGVRRLLRGNKKKIVCALSCALALGWAFSVNWVNVGVALTADRPVASYDPALLAEAKALGLGYDAVSADPSAYSGKPVLWCLVKQTGLARPFVNGNLGWIVDMPGGDLEPVATGRMAVCKPTLARVAAGAGSGVRLDFIAHP